MHIIQPLVVLVAYGAVIGTALLAKLDYRPRNRDTDWDAE